MREHDEQGVATMVMVGVLAVVMMLSGAAAVIAGYQLGYHRARAAADLSALSAATAFERGEDACDQARRTAVQNGAELIDCDQVGDIVDFVITVQVSVVTDTGVAGLPKIITAEAHAGPVH